MSERYYVESPLFPGTVELIGPEAHHLATVCRLRPGATVCLFNGDGYEYPARVVTAARRAVTLEVTEVREPIRERTVRVEVAAPLPRGDRGPFLVEKLTELGVTTFVPLICQRGVVHPGEGKRDKLVRYVIEASKQCGRNVLMEVAEPAEWANWCALAPSGVRRLLAHPDAAPDRLTAIAPQLRTHRGAVRLAVGPEGGFTNEEVDLARTHGWQLVDLGPRILRVETAAITLAALTASWLDEAADEAAREK